MFWAILVEMENLAGVKLRFSAVRDLLDERSRRLVVAAESVALGRGGISAASRATGISRPVIRQGIKELKAPVKVAPGRVRRPGGGRKRVAERDPSVVSDLEKLVEPVTRGDPESPLRWTCKSVRRLAEELSKLGHSISYPVVAELLHELGYSLQANQKTKEGDSHPDRNAQFEHINRKVKRCLADKQPVISVDTKKKELVGDFKNGGQEVRPKGNPEQVRVHDFVIPELGRANPYGIYDLAHNTGWVSVGVDHDTAAFAVEKHPALVAINGAACLSQGQKTTHHSGWWWQQRRPRTALENGIAEVRRRNRVAHCCLPLPARHQQMEQNRTSPVQLYHPELARQAAGQLRGHCQPHRGNHDHERVESSFRTGHQHVSSWAQGVRQGLRPGPTSARQVPR